MSYRDETKKKVKVFLENNNNNVEQIVKEIYSKALDESKKTGQSVESITYEILEGLEESTIWNSEQIEEGLKQVAFIIATIIHHSAQENIYRKGRSMNLAKLQLEHAIETEQARLWESLDTFKHYAHDKSYKIFSQYLEKIESDILEMVYLLENKIEYNHLTNLGKGT